MNKILCMFLFVLLSATSFSTTLNKEDELCRLGFSYEISNNIHWGLGKPVITKIFPYTPAEQAGLKLGDIIESIEEKPITTLATEEIIEYLNPAGKNTVTVGIKNLHYINRVITIPLDCKKVNAIDEEHLAKAFAFYSLENAYSRNFICPFTTKETKDSTLFSHFKTFGFTPIYNTDNTLDVELNRYIQQELEIRGLRYVTENPDLLVETYYFFDINKNFKGENKVTTNKKAKPRYNTNTFKMEEFPFLKVGSSETEAAYLLQLGIKLVDQRLQKGRILWECTANEMLKEPYLLNLYAKVHIPLMLRQYPYTKNYNNLSYSIEYTKYNYTGINFDINNLSHIIDVDPNSPAWAAGIRGGDIIESINGIPMESSPDILSSAYKQFITNTFELRNDSTIYTDANGFTRCMLWDSFNYTKVAEQIKRKNNKAVFSYLFGFMPYVKPTGDNTCTIIIRKGNDLVEYLIRPSIRRIVSLENK